MDSAFLHILSMMASLTLAPPVENPVPSHHMPIPLAKPATPLFWQPPIQQWPALLARHKTMMNTYSLCQETGRQCVSAKVSHWQDFLGLLQTQKPLVQLIAVNDYINARPYKQDNWLYNVSDHWADVADFLENSGDCEDFAIAKYFSLRQLGFDTGMMQIMLVYDVYSGTDHAVLRVALNDQLYFLDNRDDVIDRAEFDRRYRPHIAFNETDVHLYDQPLMARSIRGDDARILPGNR